MRVEERSLEIPAERLSGAAPEALFAALAREVGGRLKPGEVPVRFAIVRSKERVLECEVGVLNAPADGEPASGALFDFRPRERRSAGPWTTALLIPTGIGCEIGGHAGDAGPVARLLGAVSDRLLLHPNVVNGSDINEMPANAWYVEGSVLSRLLQGTVALEPVRANRVLVVMDDSGDRLGSAAVINSVNAARATYGLECPRILALFPPVRVEAQYAPSGRAVGSITGLDRLAGVLERERGTYDAVALAGAISLPPGLYEQYLRSDGGVVNPLGGAEAMLTHALSLQLDVPIAHAPILSGEEMSLDSLSESELLASQRGTDLGFGAEVVDPRLAAELISVGFLQCVLKGLQRSPAIRSLDSDSPEGRRPDGVSLTAEGVSCLVIPDGVLGLPVLAALQQDIPVIAVRENRNRMRNDLARLPWGHGQFIPVESYFEAAGVIAALRDGLSLPSLRRPLERVPVEIVR